MDELVDALGAPRRDERRRRGAPARGARRRPREDRSHPARHSRSRPTRRSKDELGVDGRVGHPHVRAALAGQGHRARHRRAARDPRAASRTPSTSCSAPRIRTSRSDTARPIGSCSRAAREQLGVDANVIFHNRFVSHDELVEFLGAADIYVTPYLKPEQITSGTLAYAVGSRQGGDLDAVSVRARAPRRRSRRPRSVARLGRDRARGHRPPRRPKQARRAPAARRRVRRGDELAGRRAALRRELRAGARRRTPSAVAQRLAAQTLAKRPPELPEINLAHLRAMTDDTGILQHAAFNVPRYDDGYCLDDNARALLLMTLVEEAGTEAPHVVRALASRYLAFVSHAFDETTGASGTSCRTRGAGTRSRAPRTATGARSGRSAPSSAARRIRDGRASRRSSSTRRFPRRRAHEPARVGLRAARHRRIPARVPGRQQRRVDRRRRSRRKLLERFRASRATGLAVVRGPPHLLQRAPVAGAARVRRVDGQRGDDERRPALARLARDAAIAPRTASSRRSARTASTCAARRARRSISNPSRRARWSRRASTRIA